MHKTKKKVKESVSDAELQSTLVLYKCVKDNLLCLRQQCCVVNLYRMYSFVSMITSLQKKKEKV
jgi:hypothetical protein